METANGKDTYLVSKTPYKPVIKPKTVHYDCNDYGIALFDEDLIASDWYIVE